MPLPWRSLTSGQAWASSFHKITGRKLAKSSNSLRKRNSAARSGRLSFATVGSRSGRPTEPNRIASAFLQSASAASGKALLAASMPAQPTGASLMSNRTGNFVSTARNTLIASRITSGPMPSPAKAATLNVCKFIMGAQLTKMNLRSGEISSQKLRRGSQVPFNRLDLVEHESNFEGKAAAPRLSQNVLIELCKFEGQVGWWHLGRSHRV